MREIKVLLVEDNEGDIILTFEALKESKIKNCITIARDGEIAINLLKKGDIPDLVLLDINLPKIDGKEVLNYIKSTENLKHIPVIMLTTSVSEVDIMESYRMHANCYISKPVNLEKFNEVILAIEKFWIETIQLPLNGRK